VQFQQMLLGKPPMLGLYISGLKTIHHLLSTIHPPAPRHYPLTCRGGL
jgi:hypothetical protein